VSGLLSAELLLLLLLPLEFSMPREVCQAKV
jgi:hypothetical protein